MSTHKAGGGSKGEGNSRFAKVQVSWVQVSWFNPSVCKLLDYQPHSSDFHCYHSAQETWGFFPA